MNSSISWTCWNCWSYKEYWSKRSIRCVQKFPVLFFWKLKTTDNWKLVVYKKVFHTLIVWKILHMFVCCLIFITWGWALSSRKNHQSTSLPRNRSFLFQCTIQTSQFFTLVLHNDRLFSFHQFIINNSLWI